MRGDRPQPGSEYDPRLPFPPHARGSTYIEDSVLCSKSVYPACAGIDRLFLAGTVGQVGLPRMRGDRPQFPKTEGGTQRFTPHARGSTPCQGKLFFPPKVYPACAGSTLFEKLPHAPLLAFNSACAGIDRLWPLGARC